jgi:hypothetical protein
MSIKVKYLSVVIPIRNIEKCVKVGGLKGILEKQKEYVGKRVRVDEFLYKDGAMSPADIEIIVNFWQDQGLVLTEIKDGKKVWKDLCVVDMASGPTLPCDWLEYDRETFTVWMKGGS